MKINRVSHIKGVRIFFGYNYKLSSSIDAFIIKQGMTLFTYNICFNSYLYNVCETYVKIRPIMYHLAITQTYDQ